MIGAHHWTLSAQMQMQMQMQMKEYNSKVKRQWSQKALHDRHPYDLSQQYVDIEASSKWLTNADLFAETEDF